MCLARLSCEIKPHNRYLSGFCEQNARIALWIADRGYVLETGKIIKEGTGEELLADEAVQKAYLGG